MDAHNVGVAREAFAAFAARDLGRLGRTLADDVSWHTPGANVLAGDYH
jgi:ketosteroid isomerase-like protein